MSLCTSIRARIMIAAIFFVAFVVRVPNFLDMRLVEKRLYAEHGNGTYSRLVLEWRGDLYNNAVYSFIVPGFLAGLLPLVLLAGLNTRLVVEIRKSTRYLRYVQGCPRGTSGTFRLSTRYLRYAPQWGTAD